MTRRNARALLIICWLGSLPVIAQAQTFFEAVIGTDYSSLFAASLVAMVSSVVSTGLFLLSKIKVDDVLRTLAYDTLYAFSAGVFVWGLIEAARQEDLWHPKNATWLLMIGIAGVLRKRVFVWAGEFITDAIPLLRARALPKTDSAEGQR